MLRILIIEKKGAATNGCSFFIERFKVKELLLWKIEKEELRLIKLLIEKELTEREIGKILGISQVAVNKIKHKVFDKLRTLLKDLMTIFM